MTGGNQNSQELSFLPAVPNVFRMSAAGTQEQETLLSNDESSGLSARNIQKTGLRGRRPVV